MAAAEPTSPPAVRDIDLHTDPTGALPVYRWRQAPQGLATRRQLRERRLRPGGQDPVAVIECRGGKRRAWLYEIDKALPVRPMTLAKEAALDKAMARRQTCPACSRRYYHCLPLRTLGTCLECHDGTPAAPDSYMRPPGEHFATAA
ncbi:RRQRL motif-containing zinc-binding protein [Streptomyces sp. NPDC057496]|uniref:RRQRL motif-containing zinc-binding protein n=1 Tax=Streptomyces sp. NPDC057496 TaxID=3346149 RepID=UPI00368C9691